MKVITETLILFFYFVLIGCHTPKGLYCSQPNYIGSCIEFLNSREFINHGFSDHGAPSMNYGKFYKVGNRLVLRYMKIPGIHKYKSKSIFNINGFESKSDSIKLKISCFEIDSTKIDYFDYSIKNLKTDSLIFYRKPYMLNQENINLPKTPDSLKLRIAWRSNETEILLNGQNNYQIDLYLENMAKPRYNSYSGIIQMYSRRKEDGKKILVRKNSKYEFKLYEK